MFSCRACTKRALANICENGLLPEASLAYLKATAPLLVTRRAYSTPSVRANPSYATEAEVEEVGSRHALQKNSHSMKPHRESVSASSRAVSKSAEWAAKKQLEYLTDPLFIAQQVERYLAKNRFDDAAILVRKASGSQKVTVSWNHLIDYQLKNHRLHAALKLYNEMKKRAQLPNAHTYTIIFRGCANSPHPKLAVSECSKLYNNMLANGRITPSIIHLNAVLQVCARAHDLETMFTLVKSADDRVRAPNSQTYTTIINALRAVAENPQMESVLPDEVEEDITTKMIQRAMAIWDEVIGKWRNADLIMDESLVCAMGRLLLLGSYHESNGIFSLLHQTMNIPYEATQLNILYRQVTAGSRGTELVAGAEKARQPAVKQDQLTGPGPKIVFSQVNASGLNYAKPSNNTLSMVLKAIQNTGKTTLAHHYWAVFTNAFKVKPDTENWYSLISAFRRGKNSTRSADYLAMMPKEAVSPKIFRTAMTTCLRDNLNTSSFTNATRVLEAMITSLRVPDPQALRTYLRVSYANKRNFEQTPDAAKDPNVGKLAWGRQLRLALDNIWEPYAICAKQLTFGGLGPVLDKDSVKPSEQRTWKNESNDRAELVALARRMIATYDRLIFDNMVTPEVAKQLVPRRNSLNRFVTKFYEDRQALEPDWRGKVLNQTPKGSATMRDGEDIEEDEEW
ncbi:hypothetical protein BX600DRAFT_456822 [Xylariales sp. PMI_506]|nr:hypothetical protein BX600DRAFT_456822 [Xylariales sp. PMI_506]